MALRRGSRLLISIGFTITLPSAILTAPAAHAAPVYDSQVKMGDPEDLDAIIGTLLEARENGHLAAATFKFLNTPPPASDGVLTVIAAGDLGIGLDDEGIVVEEDFIRVFPPGGAVLGILSTSRACSWTRTDRFLPIRLTFRSECFADRAFTTQWTAWA